jgi:hypothetical protein
MTFTLFCLSRDLFVSQKREIFAGGDKKLKLHGEGHGKGEKKWEIVVVTFQEAFFAVQRMNEGLNDEVCTMRGFLIDRFTQRTMNVNGKSFLSFHENDELQQIVNLSLAPDMIHARHECK